MSMNAGQLEEEALKLDRAERGGLAARLLESLDGVDDSLTDEEWCEVWGREAQRRDAEMTAGPSLGTPAEEALRRVRARLK
jgi:hypothetical protein